MTFFRSEGEKYMELREFEHALKQGFDDTPIEDGTSRYSPGADIKRFYATKPKRHPTTDTEKAVFWRCPMFHTILDRTATC